jgi:hypothetical protein
MVTGPDHSHSRRCRLAVVAPEIVTNCVEQPPVGSEIVRHWLGHTAAPRETAREFFVPTSDLFRARDDLPPSDGAVPFIGPVPLPQVEHCIPGEAERGRAGDETGYLCERDGLGPSLGEIATEGVVEAS